MPFHCSGVKTKSTVQTLVIWKRSSALKSFESMPAPARILYDAKNKNASALHLMVTILPEWSLACKVWCRYYTRRRHNVKKLLISALFGLALGVGAAQAEVVVRVGPPRPVVETRTVSPG